MLRCMLEASECSAKTTPALSFRMRRRDGVAFRLPGAARAGSLKRWKGRSWWLSTCEVEVRLGESLQDSWRMPTCRRRLVPAKSQGMHSEISAPYE
jgi:hypothetical protein